MSKIIPRYIQAVEYKIQINGPVYRNLHFLISFPLSSPPYSHLSPHHLLFPFLLLFSSLLLSTLLPILPSSFFSYLTPPSLPSLLLPFSRSLLSLVYHCSASLFDIENVDGAHASACFDYYALII